MNISNKIKLLSLCNLIPFLIILCSSISLAQEVSKDEVLYEKPFRSGNKDLLLRLFVNNHHIQKFVWNGHEETTTGVLRRLVVFPVDSFGQVQSKNSRTIWRLRSSTPLTLNNIRTNGIKADCYIDSIEDKVYLVLATSHSFVIYLANMNDNVKEPPSKVEVHTVPDDSPILQKTRNNIISSPDEFIIDDVEIDQIKIDKEGEKLLVQIGFDENIKQKWSLSLTDRIWKKTFDATAERLAKEKAVEAERKKNQTPDRPPVSEVLLWKETLGTKYEGAGVWVKRENVPAGKIAQSMTDSPDFPEYLQKPLPKDSWLYWAEDHNWHEPETPEITSLGWLSFYALWTLRAPNVNADGKESQFKVFDAMHNAEGEHGEKPGAFAIVYQHDGVLYAVVTRPNPNNEKKRDEMPLQDAKLLSDLTVEQVKSATLTGSINDMNVAVDIELANGTRRRWFLVREDDKDSWIEQE